MFDGDGKMKDIKQVDSKIWVVLSVSSIKTFELTFSSKYCRTFFFSTWEKSHMVMAW